MLGVLGGMGPAATVDFLGRVVRLTPAKRDQEHLPVVVFANPQVPDRSAAILDAGPDPLPHLLEGVEFLNLGRVDVIAIPCNTSHHWYEALSARSVAPILHIAQVTVASIPPGADQRVAVFATRGTLASGFYARELQRHRVASFAVDESLHACIRDVKEANVADGARRIGFAAAAAAAGGASALILGCTELSIAVEGAGPVDLPIFDSSQQLAAAAVRLGLQRGWSPARAGSTDARSLYERSCQTTPVHTWPSSCCQATRNVVPRGRRGDRSTSSCRCSSRAATSTATISASRKSK